jgi:hypothetical protein
MEYENAAGMDPIEDGLESLCRMALNALEMVWKEEFMRN